MTVLSYEIILAVSRWQRARSCVLESAFCGLINRSVVEYTADVRAFSELYANIQEDLPGYVASYRL